MDERERILIIDENDDTRELATRLIERDFREVEVIGLAWPNAALDFASGHPVRLAVINANMGAVKSGDFVRALREKAAGLSVIAMGGEEADQGERSSAMGADRFLSVHRLAFELPDCVRALLKPAGD